MKPYVSVYRKLLARALKAAWFHRGLWFFGFLAGLLQTGAVTNDVLRLAPALQPGTISWQNLEASWNGFTFGKTLLAGLAVGTTEQVLATVLYTVGAAVIFALLVLSSQHLLLTSAHRAAANKKPMHWRDVNRELRTIHIGRLFSLNVLGKIAMLIVILGGGLLLQQLVAVLPGIDALLAFAMYMLVLPLAFAVGAIAMMALVYVTKNNATVFSALRMSGSFVTTHWLATLEYAAILFLINFLFTGLLIVGLVLLAQLLVALFAASVASASLLLILFMFSAVLVVGLIAVVCGFMTTFNYCSWNEFVEKFAKAPAHPRTEHAAAWLRKALVR